MKITVLPQPNTELEVIIKCSQADSQEVEELISLLSCSNKKIPSRKNQETTMISFSSILYGEVVNRTVFLYTANDIYSTSYTLQQLENELNFLRCSKTMVVNLKQITHLKSMIGAKILATLSNNEKILISRHYASALREALQLYSKKRGV